MKKFKFALDTVLSYKQQVLGVLQGEHAEAVARVRAQEDVLEKLWREYRDCNEDYRDRALEGMPVTEALMYQNALRAAELEIQRETKRLEELEAGLHTLVVCHARGVRLQHGAEACKEVIFLELGELLFAHRAFHAGESRLLLGTGEFAEGGCEGVGESLVLT